jgi:hypothetical protein
MCDNLLQRRDAREVGQRGGQRHHLFLPPQHLADIVRLLGGKAVADRPVQPPVPHCRHDRGMTARETRQERGKFTYPIQRVGKDMLIDLPHHRLIA